MTNMNQAPTPEQYAREILAHSQQVLGDAVELVAGDRTADPRDIFPEPTEKRDEGEVLNLTPEQSSRLRELAAELGVGRERDQSLSELGLHGAHVVIEGGQPHKIKAELAMVLADEAAAPRSIVLAASKERAISNQDEQDSARHQGVHGGDSYTEYDVAERLARQIPGFIALDEPVVLPYGYDVAEPAQVKPEPTGQLVHIGTIGGTPVNLLRIDREYYIDEPTGKRKYNQPGTSEVLQFVAGVHAEDDAPLAFVTSATYLPSRNVAVTQAALRSERVMGTASYGTERLAHVKDEAAPAPVATNQLPGEFHALADDIAKLAAELGA